MHLNMSLFRDGKNLFYDPDDPRGLSQMAYSFIAGLLEHVKGFTALTNPLVNSYKRLVPGYEAPCYLAWSASNRSALIRIPAARAQATRVELRCPDPTCNPYLALAVCLAAGLDGIEKGLTPPEEVTDNIFAMDDAPAPRTASKAAGHAQGGHRRHGSRCAHLRYAGQACYHAVCRGQEARVGRYRTHVSDWELGKYLVIY